MPAAAPRTEEELFAYVREVYVRAAQQGGGSAGERLAALRAAGVATDEEAQNILARLARADSTPTQLEALRAAGIPPPPPQPLECEGSSTARLALDALRAAGIPPPPPQPRESVHLQAFAPARFRTSSPLHDDAAALRERSAADDRAEAGLE